MKIYENCAFFSGRWRYDTVFEFLLLQINPVSFMICILFLISESDALLDFFAFFCGDRFFLGFFSHFRLFFLILDSERVFFLAKSFLNHFKKWSLRLVCFFLLRNYLRQKSIEFFSVDEIGEILTFISFITIYIFISAYLLWRINSVLINQL